jgi:hypothetical protein
LCCAQKKVATPRKAKFKTIEVKDRFSDNWYGSLTATGSARMATIHETNKSPTKEEIMKKLSQLKKEDIIGKSDSPLKK